MALVVLVLVRTSLLVQFMIMTDGSQPLLMQLVLLMFMQQLLLETL